MAETITEDGEVVSDRGADIAALSVPSQSALSTIVRAEVETMITTAKTYPRSIDTARKMIRSIVTVDAEAAKECIYALPRGGKAVRGPSARFAEAVLQSWGNAMVDSMVTQVDREEKVVVATATYRDLQTNITRRAAVRRRIVDSKGKIYNEDMIIMTGNAACSIASRNATLAGVPKPIWSEAYEACLKVIAGDVKTLSATRQDAVAAFAHFGVKPEQVFAAIEVKGLDDIQLDHIITLRGMFSAIKNEEATVEEMFGRKGSGGGVGGREPLVKDPLKETPIDDDTPVDTRGGAKEKAEADKPKADEAPAIGQVVGSQEPAESGPADASAPPKGEDAATPSAASSPGPAKTEAKKAAPEPAQVVYTYETYMERVIKMAKEATNGELLQQLYNEDRVNIRQSHAFIAAMEGHPDYVNEFKTIIVNRKKELSGG